MSRDIADYTEKYIKLPFEPVQIAYRRKMVLAQIARLKPKKMMEIGCGDLPLFLDLPIGIDHTIIEPSAHFAATATKLAEGRTDIRIHHGYMEDFADTAQDYDLIILSGVLHEVTEPLKMLRAIQKHCGPNTVFHVNVPNAKSLHRLIGVSMGLIEKPGSTSPMQRAMQQRGITYDQDLLQSELAETGFSAFENGSYFVKPFTHAQMQELIDNGFMTPAILDGLDKLIEWMPEYGSEIWANARITP